MILIPPLWLIDPDQPELTPEQVWLRKNAITVERYELATETREGTSGASRTKESC